MSALEIGQIVPDFTATATSGTTFKLSDYRGKSNLIIYFYPKDDTPGCTKESCSFRDNKAEFDNIVIRQTSEGGRVFLRDIATVTDGFQDLDFQANFKGEEAAFFRADS